MAKANIHKTAEISDKAKIGKDTAIWHHSHVRENAKIGNNCIIGKNVYIDFDVEIGRDILTDYDKNGIENFVLWSGDSDFADPIKQLLINGKKVVIFATARRVSSELSALTKDGLFIFDIQKIRNFICWKRDIAA